MGIRLVKPERNTVRYAIEQPGFNIEAFQETALYAKISGYVQQWNADLGDRVRKDQVLAELYVPEMEGEVKQKEASVQQASAQVEQARAAILTAQAQLERAQSQFERFQRAGKNGTLDQENIEEARLGFEASRAALAKARADLTGAQAALEVSKANRDIAKTLLQYRYIRAPYDGIITQRYVNKGDFIQPAGARPLFIVNQIHPVRVFVNVPGVDAPWIKDGDPVTLRLQGAGGEFFQGKVTRNSRSLNPQSRTLRTEIDLPNPQGKLLPGMYVQSSITVEHRHVWTLPAAAIATEGEQTFCYRVENGKALRTPLQIGLTGSGLVEVLKKQVPALSPGGEAKWEDFTGDEFVVASNPTALSDGQDV
jgi:multidrug efflux pump subunit AcrA (membrane-fusion protein)